MKGAYNMDNKKIIEELLSYPHETEWIEFKTNYWDFKGIGEYISALSNSAAVLGKKQGYLAWGIDNDNHEVLGTNIDYNKDIVLQKIVFKLVFCLILLKLVTAKTITV